MPDRWTSEVGCGSHCCDGHYVKVRPRCGKLSADRGGAGYTEVGTLRYQIEPAATQVPRKEEHDS